MLENFSNPLIQISFEFISRTSSVKWYRQPWQGLGEGDTAVAEKTELVNEKNLHFFSFSGKSQLNYEEVRDKIVYPD